MSLAPRISPDVRASAKEKGGSPEDARQGKNPMHTAVMEARPAGNIQPVNTAGFHTESARKKLAIWLDSLVAKSKDRPVTQIVSLTPEMAEMLLDRNPANRKITQSVVDTYAHDITRGAWAFNGQTVIVSDTGELSDGQHRCSAVIAAGRPIDILLIVGIKRDTRTTLDQGRVRTAGDYLSMEGNINTLVLAAAANYTWQYRNRGILSTAGYNKATKSEVVEFVREHPGLVKSVSFVNGPSAAAVGGPSILAFVHFTLKGTKHPEDADYFVHSLMNGAGLKAGDPILYARNRLINERGRARANEKGEIIFKAWNAWRRGEKLSRVQIAGGVLPVLED